MRAATVVILAAHSAIQRAASPRKAVVSKRKHTAAGGACRACIELITNTRSRWRWRSWSGAWRAWRTWRRIIACLGRVKDVQKRILVLEYSSENILKAVFVLKKEECNANQVGVAFVILAITAPFSLQSMESGKLSPATGAYRSLSLFALLRPASRLAPRKPVRYSSLVISANRFNPSLYDRFPRLFFSSMYLRLSLKILNLLSFSSTALYDLPCFTSHDSNISFTSSSLRTMPFTGCC
nr:hypothetical protein Itr_chr01CG21830 [Ipomoea trifida]